jgi:hypothetical protein
MVSSPYIIYDVTHTKLGTIEFVLVNMATRLALDATNEHTTTVSTITTNRVTTL